MCTLYTAEWVRHNGNPLRRPCLCIASHCASTGKQALSRRNWISGFSVYSILNVDTQVFQNKVKINSKWNCVCAIIISTAIISRWDWEQLNKWKLKLVHFRCRAVGFCRNEKPIAAQMSITKNMNFELELTNRKCAVDYYYPHFLHMPFHTFMHNVTLSDALWDWIRIRALHFRIIQMREILFSSLTTTGSVFSNSSLA